eukprot:81706_1
MDNLNWNIFFIKNYVNILDGILFLLEWVMWVMVWKKRLFMVMQIKTDGIIGHKNSPPTAARHEPNITPQTGSKPPHGPPTTYRHGPQTAHRHGPTAHRHGPQTTYGHGPTSTAMYGPITTAIYEATSTSMYGPITTAIYEATSTSMYGPITTAICEPTSTAIYGPPSTKRRQTYIYGHQLLLYILYITNFYTCTTNF